MKCDIVGKAATALPPSGILFSHDSNTRGTLELILGFQALRICAVVGHDFEAAENITVSVKMYLPLILPGYFTLFFNFFF